MPASNRPGSDLNIANVNDFVREQQEAASRAAKGGLDALLFGAATGALVYAAQMNRARIKQVGGDAKVQRR